MRKLWKEIISSSAAKVYALLIGILSLILTARWLGPQGRGAYVAVTTWVNLFATFGNLSLGQVALHRATTLRDRSWLASTLGSLLFITGVITLVSWGFIALLFCASHGAAFNGLSPVFLVLGFLTLPFLVWEQYGSSLLASLDQMRIYNRAQVLGRTAGIVLIVLLVARLHQGVAAVLITLLLSQLIISCAGLRYLVTHAEERIRPSLSTLRELIQGGLKLHLNAIGGFLITSTDILVINRYRGAVQTGHYQMAVQMSSVLLMIPQAASLVLFGKLAQLGPDDVWAHQRKILIGLTLAMAGIAAGSALIAPWLIPTVVGKAFLPSVPMFQLLVLGTVAMSFTTLMGSQWVGRGLFWQMSCISLTAGLLNLAANCVLVPRYGMYGSVGATMGTYAVSVLINIGMFLWIDRTVRSRHHAPPGEALISASPASLTE